MDMTFCETIKLKTIHFPVKEGVMINEIIWIWGSN